MENFDSFVDFQNWLRDTWFPRNPQAVQLDGSTTTQANRQVKVTFNLYEIPNLEGRISLHGDTTRESLMIMMNSEIDDFLIIPPQSGDRFVHWRFHHKSIHSFENDSRADGMFAYVK